MHYIKQIQISNFRNILELDLSFSKGINIFYGDNAQGKTNLLEALYLSLVGRSNRSRFDKDFVNFDADSCHVKTIIDNNSYTDKVDMHIKKEGKKGFAINSIELKKLGQLFGLQPVVFFSPDDLKLVNGSPSERRRFIDMELCQSSNLYYNNLVSYYKILKQRNTLLKKIKFDKKWKDSLFVWNEQLVSFGRNIIKERKIFVENLDVIASKNHREISAGAENLSLIYRYNVSEEDFFEKLKANLDKDIAFGNTLAGPHKDDMIFNINGKDSKFFASQGQKRTIVLSMKMALIDLIEKELGKSPILLLDDVLSELDSKRQDYIISNTSNIQIFITCTGMEKMQDLKKENTFFFNVVGGNFYRKT